MPYKNCQSCDMPLNKDPKHGGTNADGTQSDKYCSFCYVDGDFTIKTDDARAFQAQVVDLMVQDGWMRPIAWLFTRRIPKLERWTKR